MVVDEEFVVEQGLKDVVSECQRGVVVIEHVFTVKATIPPTVMLD